MRGFTGLISTGFPLIHLIKRKTYVVTLNRQWMVLNSLQSNTLLIKDCVMHETLVNIAIVMQGGFLHHLILNFFTKFTQFMITTQPKFLRLLPALILLDSYYFIQKIPTKGMRK